MINIRTTDRTQQMRQAIKDIKTMEVYVGIPQAENSVRGKVSNAELLFIHSNGSPLRNIPARPVIEPAIEDDKEIIGQLLGDALKAALDGDNQTADELLKKAGLEGQAVSQEWFDNPMNGWEPNALSTQKKKIKKGSTDPKPLIDTGELRRSITYVIGKK